MVKPIPTLKCLDNKLHCSVFFVRPHVWHMRPFDRRTGKRFDLSFWPNIRCCQRKSDKGTLRRDNCDK